VSTREIKATIDQMTEDERFFAAAYLHHLAQSGDAAYRAKLGTRMNRMEAGQKFSLEQAERLHAALEAEGF
jgi:hypothetical protein